MKRKALLTLLYGLLIFAGGIFGYYKSGSFPSLFMGVAFGILLVISAIGTFKDSVLAIFSSLILTAILAFFFVWRFYKTHTIFPAGILGIVSILVFVALLVIPNRRKS